MTTGEWILIKDVLQKEMMLSTDESLDAKIAMILVQIEAEIEPFIKPRGNCKVCGRRFNDLDMQVEKSRPKDICSTCFTSNA